MKIRWMCVYALALAAMRLHAQSSSVAAPTLAIAPLNVAQSVRLALERSPELQSAEAAIRAMEHRVPQAAALPDPTIAVGWAGKAEPMVTMAGDASSYRGVTVSEQFPYPGKRRVAGQIAASDVATAKADCEALRRRITLEVETAYAEYFYAGKAIDSAHRQQELLQKLAQVAEAQYRVGKAMQPDVLRAQVDLSLMREKLAMLEEQRITAMATLNAALQQSPETELGAAEELPSLPLRFSLEELYKLAEENDAGLAKSQAGIARGQLSVALAAKQTRPDIGVSYMFQQRTNQPDMNGVTVSVALPIFAKTKQREARSEAAESLHSAERMRESQRTSLRAEMRKQYVAMETADRLLALYAKAIAPQSALAFESSLAAYQNGKIDFQSLAASLDSLLDTEVSTYRQQANRFAAIAQMESYTGEAITAGSAQNANAGEKVEK